MAIEDKLISLASYSANVNGSNFGGNWIGVTGTDCALFIYRSIFHVLLKHTLRNTTDLSSYAWV